MTPGMRFAAAFWIGWAFHLSSNLIVTTATAESYVWMTIAIICAFVLVFIYSKNKVLFEKEFAWMMLKTGGPKEEPKVSFRNRPMAPATPMPKVKPVKPPKTK
jgi:hypothetical protein